MRHDLASQLEGELSRATREGWLLGIVMADYETASASLTQLRGYRKMGREAKTIGGENRMQVISSLL